MKHPPYLRSSDAVTLLFLVIVTVIHLLFADRIPHWSSAVVTNLLLGTAIVLSARSVHRRGAQSNLAVRLFRDWYLVPSILIIYTQTSAAAFPLHGRDFDTVLIAADRWLFGTDPTHWAGQFAHPVLTELLQLAYSSYYLFFIVLFYELYRREDHTWFRSGAMLVVYGFYLSYIGYMLVPAVGPRFTLHDFTMTDAELPGLFLTEYLRAFINAGGGAPAGTADPLLTVHRDAFPSGHTQLTLVAMYIAVAARTRIRWWLVAGGTLLIISTIYLRYHYVIDVLAGMLFFLFTIWSGRRIDAWWNRKQITSAGEQINSDVS
ncbi:MAG: phosphatase PAP2 family protein [Bacteroidetes bacterium]|nr:phosphatase PAP2 family protein [Bacteroidota bacterium]